LSGSKKTFIFSLFDVVMFISEELRWSLKGFYQAIYLSPDETGNLKLITFNLMFFFLLTFYTTVLGLFQ
jgi:hypothetical protein